MLALTAARLDPRVRQPVGVPLAPTLPSLAALDSRLEGAYARLAARWGRQALAQWRGWLERRRQGKALDVRAHSRMWAPRTGRLALQRFREEKERGLRLRKGEAGFKALAWRRLRQQSEAHRQQQQSQEARDERATDARRRWALRTWRRRLDAAKARRAAETALVAAGERRRRLRRGFLALQAHARRRGWLRTAAAAAHRRGRLAWALRGLGARARARGRQRFMLSLAVAAHQEGLEGVRQSRRERAARQALGRWRRRAAVTRRCRAVGASLARRRKERLWQHWRRHLRETHGRKRAEAAACWALRRWRRRAMARGARRALMESRIARHYATTKARRRLRQWRAWAARASTERGERKASMRDAEALAQQIRQRRALRQWRGRARARAEARPHAEASQELARALHEKARLRSALADWSGRAREAGHRRLWRRVADRHRSRRPRRWAVRRWARRARRAPILRRCFAEQAAIADEAHGRRRLQGALRIWRRRAGLRAVARVKLEAAAAWHRTRLLGLALTAWRRRGRLRRRAGIQEQVLALWRRHRLLRAFQRWRVRAARRAQLGLLEQLGEEAANCRMSEEDPERQRAALQAWRAWAAAHRGHAVRQRRATLAAGAAAEGQRLRSLKRAVGQWDAWATAACVQRARLEVAERTQLSWALLRALQAWRTALGRGEAGTAAVAVEAEAEAAAAAAAAAAVGATAPRVVVVRRRRRREGQQGQGEEEDPLPV